MVRNAGGDEEGRGWGISRTSWGRDEASGDSTC
jgi:hypothetical protein